MIQLKILNIDNHTFDLIDKNKNKYKLNLEFYGILDDPSANDYIFLCEKLLDKNFEGYCGSYSFGPLDEKYGKENVLPNDEDSLVLIKNNKKIFLKRFYG